ncbi:prefoldin subunit 6, putative [Ichthyophthirius multifiliis]|uniref:Prefoldin subunit 6, putative n=1 Tax=Ichthyophthirius multifiliis TaxID=5932 RepID=G0QKF4_ICHMU|nr:prefoldin subunit 6, putative [Ichthyophthirius multifiliis]EGR34295.1 prefoldin subunit 6, putative [Ichthyophthirius multifiliis]|eukprot:XP_004039599.1 prefoldin subunit 6, putative [Ichthyophthirius multifiliis]
MSGEVAKLQSQLEIEVKEMQNLQKDLQKLNEGRQRLLEQQNESDLVKKEVDLLEEGANIFKLIGPVLVKQTLQESKQTIEKRLEFIRKEAIKVELLLKDNEQKQHDKKSKIVKLQENYYKTAMGPQYEQALSQQQQKQQAQ